jgi:hypothetical protein
VQAGVGEGLPDGFAKLRDDDLLRLGDGVARAEKNDYGEEDEESGSGLFHWR